MPFSFFQFSAAAKLCKAAALRRGKGADIQVSAAQQKTGKRAVVAAGAAHAHRRTQIVNIGFQRRIALQKSAVRALRKLLLFCKKRRIQNRIAAPRIAAFRQHLLRAYDRSGKRIRQRTEIVPGKGFAQLSDLKPSARKKQSLVFSSALEQHLGVVVVVTQGEGVQKLASAQHAVQKGIDLAAPRTDQLFDPLRVRAFDLAAAAFR